MPEGGGWEACVRSCCHSSQTFRDELELREVDMEGGALGRKEEQLQVREAAGRSEDGQGLVGDGWPWAGVFSVSKGTPERFPIREMISSAFCLGTIILPRMSAWMPVEASLVDCGS